jgi:hypothetical protein
LSDLQCAATFVFAVAGDEAQMRALAADLRFRRVAVVYAGGGAGPERSARTLSEALGVPLRTEPELDGGNASALLEEIADQHRGETVLVVTAGPLLGDVVEMRVDADGWVVDSRASGGRSSGRA